MTARVLSFCAVLSFAACTPASSPSAPAAAAAPVVDVVELSAADARDRLAAGTVTSRALTEAYLTRIAAVDKAGPALNSVIELNPQALADADRLDGERKAGTVRGPLHGLPVLLKDNIDVAGMVNSAGSLALADHRPATDAFLVARLRDAGAVILGKTNLSEWANFRSTRSTSGWSSRGGQTRHAYVLDRNPCGSSAGTGTAIAASLAALGVGTETDGSILCPAAVSGLVGLKPTVGVVSRSGIIPISISQDTAGPMTRTVTDAALMLSAIAAVDAADPSGEAARGKLPADFTAGLTAEALTGRRFGVLRQAMGYHPGVDAAMERAIATLKTAGAEVVDVRVPTYNDVERRRVPGAALRVQGRVERVSGEEQGAARLARGADRLEHGQRVAGDAVLRPGDLRAGPGQGAAHRRRLPEGPRRVAPAGRPRRPRSRRSTAASSTRSIAPAMSPTWPTDHVLGDHFVGAGYGMAAVAGTPSLTVPMGDASGLPLGLAFMSRAYTEADLLAWGFAFEQRAKARTPPTYKATLND